MANNKSKTPKNPISMIKAPVNNAEEADARKKVVLVYLICGIVGFFASVVLATFVKQVSGVFYVVGFLCGALVLLCIFLLVTLKKLKKKFGDLECPKCKERIKYDDNVRYKVVSVRNDVKAENHDRRDSNGIPQKSTVKVTGRQKAVLEVTCRCQSCGTEKTFTQEFIVAECEKTDTNVPYVQSGALQIQFKHDVTKLMEAGFDGLTVGTTTGGVQIKYLQTYKQLLEGYFGNTIQMRLK